MKKIFLSLVALMVATVSFAQSSMLATLSHGGKISTFYGATGLSDAFNAAVNGDVITLSSGSFNAVNITKAVTIRGAGATLDDTAQTEPTFIAGDFTINIPDTTTRRLTLEGIYHNQTVYVGGELKNATFLKDRFNTISNSGEAKVTNLTMIHCRVVNELYIQQGSASCVNCFINVTGSGNTVNYEFSNCILRGCVACQETSVFKNCILHTIYSNYLSSRCVAYNCVGIGFNDLFYDIPNSTNVVKSFDDVFKTYRGTFNDDEKFELTDDAQTSLLGLDGTQVGIYGGNMPFSSTPTNPQITKCNVAAKSTADGKLSVDITVGGVE